MYAVELSHSCPFLQALCRAVQRLLVHVMWGMYSGGNYFKFGENFSVVPGPEFLYIHIYLSLVFL